MTELSRVPVTALKGVGAALAEKLARVGLETLQDILFHLPLRYQDRTRVTAIGALRPGADAVVEGVVAGADVVMGRRRSLLVRLQDGSGTLSLRFYHFSQAQKDGLKRGTHLRCYGEVRPGASGLEIYHPEYRALNGDEPIPVEQTLTPIYPTTEGLTQQRLRQLSQQALAMLGPSSLPDWLPAELARDYQLGPLDQAIRYLHRPPPDADIEELAEGRHWAQLRLAFEELLTHQLSLQRLREAVRSQAAPRLPAASRLPKRFLANLGFQPTGAQRRVGAEIAYDLAQDEPMLRLVQGDVGAGKTVVAALAALQAIEAGYQVALMAPTEILAEQHFLNFSKWLQPLDIEVAWLAGKLKGKARAAALERIGDGAPMVVGTHALFQDEVKFKRLALAIIDEQHRFGVQQRLALRQKGVDGRLCPHQLIMTATPIPRTLNMAVSGMRDLSIIATPPARRLSVRTFVMEQQSAVIKEALLRELLRGGQVYYLHNEVKTIEKCARDLAELVPEARIGIGHGQMHERELEQVMSDFYHKRFNVLVASTIIETGIDVPSANTILIERADKFGLAQLHQLRGRVGRSHHQAYAYLLTPPRRQMTPDAEKRLEAIANAQDLGAGFVLATHDLEIRGAGELLGDGQSGQIQAVGFTLYMEMLERAVKAIRKGEQPNLEQPLGGGPEVNLRVPALIPEDYLPDVHARLILYKRIANAPDEEGLRELQVEMIDRFGLLPDPAKNLMRLTLLKLQAEKLGILKVDAGPQGGRIEFAADTQVDPLVLIKLIQGQPNRYKFEGATLFRFQVPMERPEERFNTLEALFERLTPQTT
ncbi:ATP-dependent DNA helicase RecG [Pseudomonas aeruginosa]|uniref:ATP-dependent DNA helicase RecG n=28 Tax=Bacteria TaxID=2 RepID=A0A367MFQ4_PSEAI|nr:ATP-dependent DNA helicase RecG [Pseudomonas aeruginosa]